MKSLAIKYRPQGWDEISGQGATVTILRHQIETETQKHCYLFCGPAGCGKTTAARIFVNELNEGQGNPIELDAASNNGVDDVRQIIEQAQTKPLDAKYKCFIVDECHALSNQGWQAFLKLIEEPPTHAVFIFCTTDPQKIPKTIISRVQRYQFQKISEADIFARLMHIVYEEDIYDSSEEQNDAIPALEFIAKIADGGMRDAVTMLDQCLSYTTELTIENVCKALGLTQHNTLIHLSDCILEGNVNEAIRLIEEVHSNGIDLKQFIKQYVEFLVEVGKYYVTCDITYTKLPNTSEVKEFLEAYKLTDDVERILCLLDDMLQIDKDIKYSSNPKTYIEARILVGDK